MKKSNELTIKQAVEELLSHYHLNDNLYETRLTNAWERLMGKIIAKHTLGLRLKNAVLFIRLDSAVLREELSYAKQKIISILNKELKEEVIKDVVLQ